MQNHFEHVKFENKQNPQARFDTIKLQDLMRKEDLEVPIDNLHHVEFYIIMLVEEGTGYHTIDFTDYNYEKGTIITIRKDQIQRFMINTEVKGTMLLFTDEFLVSYLEELEALKSLQLFNEILGSPKIQLSKREFDEAILQFSRIEQEYFEKNDDYSQGIIRSELHILLAKLFRIKSKINALSSSRKYLSDFIEFQKLVESNILTSSRVQYYARELGVSSKTLNNITKSIIHKSAKEFIDEILMIQIKRLLINTEITIKELAYKTGFEESTNFYKYFKRHEHTTPEKFRQSF